LYSVQVRTIMNKFNWSRKCLDLKHPNKLFLESIYLYH